MPRIPYSDTEQVTPEYREILKGALRSQPLSDASARARPSHPNSFVWAERFFRESALEPALREIAILRVGYLSKDGYDCASPHAGGPKSSIVRSKDCGAGR